MRRRLRHLTFEQVRKACLLTLGLAIGAYEAFIEHVDRPQILIFAAGLLGLDTFLKRDEQKEKPPDAPPPGNERPPDVAG